MNNIKLVIEYDGSRYKGWQRLGNDENTIQGKIEGVLSKMAGQPIEINGAGRTDAGVHAMNQVAHFKTAQQFDIDELLQYCYQYLPQDIIIKEAEYVPEDFHARYHVKGKQYVYKITNGVFHEVFSRKYRYHIPETLDLEKMKQTLPLFIGEHDFRSFTSSRYKKKSTTRTIYKIDINQNGKDIDILFEGNGFLYNMVRVIVGTMVEVGLHRLNPKDVIQIFDNKDRSTAGPTAPAHGLFLQEVFYK